MEYCFYYSFEYCKYLLWLDTLVGLSGIVDTASSIDGVLLYAFEL